MGLSCPRGETRESVTLSLPHQRGLGCGQALHEPRRRALMRARP